MTHNLDAAPSTYASRSGATAVTRLLALLRSRPVQSLVDQAVVSGTSFLVLLLLGRWSEPSEVGTYAIILSLAMLTISVADSLVMRPYTIRTRRPVGTPAQHAFGALLLTLSLAVLAALACLATGAALAASGALDAAEISFVVAVMVPSAVLREFCRRIAFARMRIGHALAVDLFVSSLTIVGLVLLIAGDGLTATGAALVITVANLLVSVGWFVVARSWFDRLGVRLLAILRESWTLGRWLLTSQVAMQIQGYASYWLSMLLLGAAATGVYVATMSVVALANPVLFGFFNLLTPKSVHVLHDGGTKELRQHAIRDGGILAAIMAVFCLILAAFGSQLLELFFPQADYQEGANLLIILGLATLVAAVGVPASVGLAAGERVGAMALVTGGTALLSVTMTAVALPVWGLLGAAYVLLVAEFFGSVARWISFMVLPPKPRRAHVETSCVKLSGAEK